MRDGHKIMKERLELSDEQAQLFERIRDKHFTQTNPLHADMRRIRLELMEQIFVTEPDDVVIEKLLDEFAAKQREFESQLFAHFLELKNVCQPDQLDELKRMNINLIESARPHNPQQGPRGRPPGFGSHQGPPPPPR